MSQRTPGVGTCNALQAFAYYMGHYKDCKLGHNDRKADVVGVCICTLRYPPQVP